MTAVAELDAETSERVRQHLVRALLAQLRHYDGTEPCKRWPDDRLERVAGEAVIDAMHGIALAIYPAAAIDAKATLGERAGSYARDARRFAGMGGENERWAPMYRIIADELRKVAAAL
jgi:hypothetical protein